jgi:hypothetical protein
LAHSAAQLFPEQTRIAVVRDEAEASSSGRLGWFL